MLTVKTRLRPSAVHGLGVFAEEFIPAGTVVWRFQNNFDFRVSEDFVASLPETARQRLLHYSAKWGGGYVISADDARFLNHSETPNLRTIDEPDTDVAIRDIFPGEELLEDYREFDDTFNGRPIERNIQGAEATPQADEKDRTIQGLREELERLSIEVAAARLHVCLAQPSHDQLIACQRKLEQAREALKTAATVEALWEEHTAKASHQVWTAAMPSILFDALDHLEAADVLAALSIDYRGNAS